MRPATLCGRHGVCGGVCGHGWVGCGGTELWMTELTSFIKYSFIEEENHSRVGFPCLECLATICLKENSVICGSSKARLKQICAWRNTLNLSIWVS